MCAPTKVLWETFALLGAAGLAAAAGVVGAGAARVAGACLWLVEFLCVPQGVGVVEEEWRGGDKHPEEQSQAIVSDILPFSLSVVFVL